MSNEKVLEELTRTVMNLQHEVERLSKLSPLYEVVNQQLLENLTADQTNYALENRDMIFLNPTANRTIRGMTGGVKGRMLFLANRTQAAFTITFTHQDAAATLGNRIGTPTAGSIILGVRQTAIFTYVSDPAFTGTNLWLLLIPGA